MHRVRNLLTDWRKGDAEKLMVLEMEAFDAWPGGGGWQTTAEEQERYFKENDLLGAFVTENAERIIGICTIDCKPGQKIYSYCR